MRPTTVQTTDFHLPPHICLEANNTMNHSIKNDLFGIGKLVFTSIILKWTSKWTPHTGWSTFSHVEMVKLLPFRVWKLKRCRTQTHTGKNCFWLIIQLLCLYKKKKVREGAAIHCTWLSCISNTICADDDWQKQETVTDNHWQRTDRDLNVGHVAVGPKKHSSFKSYCQSGWSPSNGTKKAVSQIWLKRLWAFKWCTSCKKHSGAVCFWKIHSTLNTPNPLNQHFERGKQHKLPIVSFVSNLKSSVFKEASFLQARDVMLSSKPVCHPDGEKQTNCGSSPKLSPGWQWF